MTFPNDPLVTSCSVLAAQHIPHLALPYFLQVPWAWHVAYAPPRPERVASPFGPLGELDGSIPRGLAELRFVQHVVGKARLLNMVFSVD